MKVGLIGCGSIGGVVAGAIDTGDIPNTELVCVFDSDGTKAKKFVDGLKRKPKIASSFEDFLAEDVDVVIEAASQGAVKEYVVAILERGCDVIVMSSGALLDGVLLDKLDKIFKRTNKRVYVPSGAVCGLDGVKSASVGRIDEIVLTTRKPPQALKGVEYLMKRQLDLDSITKSQVLYEGSAKEAVKLFPKNVNVCAALSLAGIGAKRTKIIIILDPSLKSNVHEIDVRGEFGELHTKVKNVPSPDNPKTSYLASLSAIRTLKELTKGIKVGT